LSALSGSRLTLYNQTNVTPVDGDLKQESTAGGLSFINVLVMLGRKLAVLMG